MVFIAVPDELSFGLKPEALPVAFARDIDAILTIRVGNMPPSMIGIFVLSFGAIPGIFIFAISMPIILIKLDDFFGKKTFLRVSMSSYVIFMLLELARGNIDGMYYLIFYTAVYFFISLVLTDTPREQRRPQRVRVR